ncbi:MAG: hypothetical protein LC624_07205 [Halobacteriales archaeon]|nr:hypothetical protein [Halobacteriales archaeon]
MRAVLAVLALLLAASPGLPAPGVAATRVHQGPCEEQFVAIPIPMAEAQGLTPPGFPPKPWDTGGLSPPIPALATGVTVGYRCARTTGDGIALGEVRTVGRALLVDPPAELRDPAIVNYVIILGGWTSSPEMAAVYTSWHLPGVHAGDVSFDVAQDAPALRHGQVAGSSAEGGLRITTVAAGVEEEQQPDTFRLFGFDGQGVAGYVDWSWPPGARTIESGLAVQQLDAPGAPTDVRLGVSFHYFGAYSYDLAFTAL